MPRPTQPQFDSREELKILVDVGSSEYHIDPDTSYVKKFPRVTTTEYGGIEYGDDGGRSLLVALAVAKSEGFGGSGFLLDHSRH